MKMKAIIAIVFVLSVVVAGASAAVSDNSVGDVNDNCLKFTFPSGGGKIWLQNDEGNIPDCQYQIGGTAGTWNPMPTDEESAVTIDGGATVYVKGNNPTGFSKSEDMISELIITVNIDGQTVSASGSVMSLIDDGLGTSLTIPCPYCFTSLFFYCPLITAPKLPAVELKESCYNSMFDTCPSLTTAPALPAETLADHCYENMFRDCVSLTAAPALPATALASGCYQLMFAGCMSLEVAPVLPARTLTDYCYSSMFNGCSNLKSVACHAMNISAENCTLNWLNEVSSSGIFYTPDEATWGERDISKIPADWKINYAVIDPNGGTVTSVGEGWTLEDGKYQKHFEFDTKWSNILSDFKAKPTKDGYTFGGWEPAPKSNDNLGTIQMVKAKWTTPSPEPTPTPTPTPSPEPIPASDTSNDVNLAIIIISVTIAVGLIALAYFIKKR